MLTATSVFRPNFAQAAFGVSTRSSYDVTECETYIVEASKLLDQFRPALDVVGMLPLPRVAPGMEDKNGEKWVRSQYGFFIHPECLNSATAGSAHSIKPEQIERGFLEMLKNAQRCHQKRGLGLIYQLIHARIAAGFQVRCMPKPCGGAGACSDRASTTLIFPNGETNGFSWFHEFLHLSGADNQPDQEHNEFNGRFRDAVYFWTDLCNSPAEIVDLERNSPGNCREVLTHKTNPTGLKWNEPEVAAICGPTEHYLKNERLYLSLVDRELLPELFNCGTRSTSNSCPEISQINSLLAKGGFKPFSIPNLGSDADVNRKLLSDWQKQTCFEYSAENKRSGTLSALCLAKKSREILGEIADNQSLIAEDKAVLRSYFTALQAKADFVNSGPGAFQEYPRVGNDQQSAKFLGKSIQQCLQNELLKGTALCHVYTTTLASPTARLLKYWE